MLEDLPDGYLEQYQQPVGVGHVIEVDTTRSVDVDALVTAMRDRLGGR